MEEGGDGRNGAGGLRPVRALEMTKSGFMRFEPHGPGDTGLVEWDPIAAEELELGDPVQRGHLYHEDPSVGYMAGVWDCTAMTLKFCPYPVHEFMFLLEGSVTMELADASRVTVEAGEAFVIPKGLPCKWIQPGYVRKFFMILEDPEAAPADDIASREIILPQPSGPDAGLQRLKISDPEAYSGGLPEQHSNIYFQDPSHRMQVGVWHGGPCNRALTRSARNELMCILQGTVRLGNEAGRSETFEAGDAVYVTAGEAFSWNQDVDVRKVYATYEPPLDKS